MNMMSYNHRKEVISRKNKGHVGQRTRQIRHPLDLYDEGNPLDDLSRKGMDLIFNKLALHGGQKASWSTPHLPHTCQPGQDVNDSRSSSCLVL
jgi:hypothetical protein